MKRLLGFAVALLLVVAPAAWAQVATGSIYGTVTDESGAVLPGATISISGENIAARSTTSGSQGDFRFLNLDPGAYKLTVALTGFSTVNREVKISTGVNVNLSFGLKVATVEETVTVTAETPVVDTKKTGTSTTLSREELESVPQARDPWAVLRTIPGVLVDRVNVAGNESGQQAAFVGKGASNADNMWNLDGVNITDMAATGASPTYFDYDAFEEISVTTGGNDVKVQTGGIGLNFVTKRGTNSFHGGGRGFLTHDDLQSSNLPAELKSHTLPSGAPDTRLKNPDGTFRDKADHIQQVNDYGADLGGPIVKDKLWFYGSYGVQDVRLVRLAGTRDKTKLKSYNGKINWQASSSDMVSVFYFRGQKIKEGRSPGTGFQEADSFLWNQADEKPEAGLKIPGLLKVEENHIFGPNFFINAKYAYYGTGFHLAPRGGLDKPGTLDFTNRTAIGSFLLYTTPRPQHDVNIDATAFKAALGGNNEFKFGFGWRKTPVTSSTVYGGRMLGYYFGGGGLVNIYRDRVAKYESKYVSGYVGDTFTKGRLTLNIGARYDHQTSTNVASEAVANPDFPTLLPALKFDGHGTGATWNDISPRVGLSYALDDARKTLVRASYARYAGQLAGATGSFDNPIGAVSYLQYYWDDINGDRLPQKNEVLTGAGLYYFYNIDPANPGSISSVNKIDPNLKANHDNEFVVGLEHELAANVAVSAAFTYRRSDGFTWTPRNGVSRANYFPNAPVTKTNKLGTFTAQTFFADPSKVQAGKFETNRPDYRRDYKGGELSIMKRLSNKWMARVALTYNDWVEKFPAGLNSGAVVDPTRTDNGPLVDGGQVADLSAGSGKGNILYSSQKWQVSANALYQLPWGFEVSGAAFGRQGTPLPYYIRITQGGEPAKRALVDATVDSRRYPNVWDIDFRLAKNIKFGQATVTASAEVFNAFNANTELNRVRDAGASTFYRLDEILSPRVARFGLRLTF